MQWQRLSHNNVVAVWNETFGLVGEEHAAAKFIDSTIPGKAKQGTTKINVVA